MEDSALNNLKSEFKLWGVKPQINHLKSGHIELVWQATPDKPERRYIIAKTASDWRGWMNARSKIRQLFRQDNLKLIEIIRQPPKPVIVKALSMPEPVETDAQQIKLLRSEVSDLSELLLNMMTMMKELIAAGPVNVPAFLPAPLAPIPIVTDAPVVVKKTRKPGTRSIKTTDFVGVAWSSTEALARDMGLTRRLARRKLDYLLRLGVVELNNDRWRKKPPPAPAMIAQVKKHALNGHRNH